MKMLNRARCMFPLLQPTLQQSEQMEYIVLQDRVLNLMLHSARQDASIKTRCIALCHLGQWLLLHLSHGKDNLLSHPRIREVLQVLLQALQFRHSRITSIAIDALKLCAERGQHLAAIERVPELIITSLCKALQIQKDAEADKAVLTSLMLCLGEFCMALPLAVMLQPYNEQDDTLLLQVLRTLLQVAAVALPTAEEDDVKLTIDNDFDMQQIADEKEEEASDQEKADDQTAESIQASSSASIRLCARAVAMHLINHLGHFPMARSDGSLLSSMVVEQDDSMENAQQQLQLLMLNTNLVASFIELPTLKLPAGDLVSAQQQVRVLLRDVNGKSCWDASMLYTKSQTRPIAVATEAEPNDKCHNRSQDAMLKPLPLIFDVDPIDDHLAEIEHKCPLRQPKRSAEEAQVMCNILDQRVSEQKFVASTSSCSSFALQQLNKPFQSVKAPQQYSRLLLSQLGLAAGKQSSRTHLLQRNARIMRELRNVDQQKCRETHKLAVIYVAAGQEDKQSILMNDSGSASYEKFVATLGWEIELATHEGFMGGLPRQGCGATAPYYATPFLEVVYHVATRMPSDSNEAMLLKTRHLGNDEVHIVWSEHDCDYRRDIFPTEFCDVLIVVYPLANGHFRVTVNRKPEVPWSGPLLADESVVSGACLAALVRATAINASRTKRASMPLYQQFYEERHRSLDSVSSLSNISANFVDFISRIYDANHTSMIEMVPSTTAPTEADPTSPLPKSRMRKLFKELTQKHLINKLVIDQSPEDDASTRSSTVDTTDTTSGTTPATPRRGSRRFSAMFKGFSNKKTLEPVEDVADNNSLGGDSSSGSGTLKADSVKSLASPRSHRKMSAIFKRHNKQKLKEAADNDVDSVSTEAESPEAEPDNDKPSKKTRKMSVILKGFTRKQSKQHLAKDVGDDGTEGETIKLESDENVNKAAASPRSGRRLSAMFKGFSKKHKPVKDVVDGNILVGDISPGSSTLSLRSAK